MQNRSYWLNRKVGGPTWFGLFNLKVLLNRHLNGRVGYARHDLEGVIRDDMSPMSCHWTDSITARSPRAGSRIVASPNGRGSLRAPCFNGRDLCRQVLMDCHWIVTQLFTEGSQNRGLTSVASPNGRWSFRTTCSQATCRDVPMGCHWTDTQELSVRSRNKGPRAVAQVVGQNKSVNKTTLHLERINQCLQRLRLLPPPRVV